MSLPNQILKRGKNSKKHFTGYWTFWYDTRTHTARWKRLADTMPLARAALRKLQQEITAGVFDKSYHRLILKEYYDEHYAPVFLRGQGRTAWATKQRGQIETYIMPTFGDMYLDRITLHDIEGWYVGLLERFTQCYAGHIAQTLKTMLRRAEEKFIEKSPAQRLRLKPAERHIPDTLTREQVGYMAGKLKGRDLVMFTLWVSTGLRKSEMQHLQWRDIDLVAHKLYVKAKADHPIKDSEDRAIDLTADVLAVLVPYAADKQADGYVFTDPHGQRIKDIEHYGRRLFRRLGMKGSANLLRHTFASMFLSGGGSIPELKAYMGHSSITITERHYAAYVPGRDRSIHRIDFGLSTESTWTPESTTIHKFVKTA